MLTLIFVQGMGSVLPAPLLGHQLFPAPLTTPEVRNRFFAWKKYTHLLKKPLPISGKSQDLQLENKREVEKVNEKWLIYSTVIKALEMWLLFPDLSVVCFVALNEPFHFLLSPLPLLLFGP